MLIQVDARVKEQQEHQAMVDAIARIAKDEEAFKKLQYMKKRRQELGQANHGAAAYVEGLGQLVAQYDADMWFRAIQTDKKFWQDKNNIKQYQRDNPEVMVTSR